jgi:hypothetical protein
MVQMARENPGWGYDRIARALSNVGHIVSDQTVGNILRRHGIAPAPKRSQTTTWTGFISAHVAVLAGTDFSTVEVLTWRGLATYYLLFFILLERRRVNLAGVTRNPDAIGMEQMARNAVDLDTHVPKRAADYPCLEGAAGLGEMTYPNPSFRVYQLGITLPRTRSKSAPEMDEASHAMPGAQGLPDCLCANQMSTAP